MDDSAHAISVVGGKAFRVRVYQQELFEEAKTKNVRFNYVFSSPLCSPPWYNKERAS